MTNTSTLNTNSQPSDCEPQHGESLLAYHAPEVVRLAELTKTEGGALPGRESTVGVTS